jgi:hypothetical protein
MKVATLTVALLLLACPFAFSQQQPTQAGGAKLPYGKWNPNWVNSGQRGFGLCHRYAMQHNCRTRFDMRASQCVCA